MTAYYNEIDPFAAAWLRALIARGVLPAGDVDTRSIEDVAPDDLRPYRQCHAFAGIGVWSYALRNAGVPDDYEVWTGSCPCQPFSDAGAGGGFDDERHLWPAWHWLIGERRPELVFGEQVASKAGLVWLDLVQADLENSGYACGAVNLPAAGVGAPHKRLRTFFMAHHHQGGQRIAGIPTEQAGDAARPAGGGDPDRLDDAPDAERRAGERRAQEGVGAVEQRRIGFGRPGDAGFVADGEAQRRDRRPQPDDGSAAEPPGRILPQGDGRLVVAPGEQVGLSGRTREPGEAGPLVFDPRAWSDPDWIYCRDEKWRPVEPGSFPLAHGAPQRVGRLRGYGNAIVAPLAQVFIEEALKCL